MESKPRSDSVNSKKGEEKQSKNLTGKILVAKQSMKADKTSSILT